jgi:hypothetical protein
MRILLAILILFSIIASAEEYENFEDYNRAMEQEQIRRDEQNRQAEKLQEKQFQEEMRREDQEQQLEKQLGDINSNQQKIEEEQQRQNYLMRQLRGFGYLSIFNSI